MGIFDSLFGVLGGSEKPKKWLLMINKKERVIEDNENFAATMWECLCGIEEMKIDFIILTAPEPINNIPFIQSSLSGRGRLQIEVGIIDDGCDECNKIYCNDEFSKDEIYKIIMSFYNNGEMTDVKEWTDIVYI